MLAELSVHLAKWRFRSLSQLFRLLKEHLPPAEKGNGGIVNWSSTADAKNVPRIRGKVKGTPCKRGTAETAEDAESDVNMSSCFLLSSSPISASSVVNAAKPSSSFVERSHLHSPAWS